jgi:hypothetical protein
MTLDSTAPPDLSIFSSENESDIALRLWKSAETKWRMTRKSSSEILTVAQCTMIMDLRPASSFRTRHPDSRLMQTSSAKS